MVLMWGNFEYYVGRCVADSSPFLFFKVLKLTCLHTMLLILTAILIHILKIHEHF